MASMYLYSIAFLIAFALAQSSDENPPVINPHSETIWMVGTVQNVAWDITGIDVWDDAGHPLTGKVILGYLIDSESQHLWEDEPLAQGIPFLQKETEVVVPDVPTGTTYFIALEGDSGNWGQLFTIINPTEPSGIAPPSSLVISTVPANFTSSTRSSIITTPAVMNSTSLLSSSTVPSNPSNTASASPTETKQPSNAGERMPNPRAVLTLPFVIWMACKIIL